MRPYQSPTILALVAADVGVTFTPLRVGLAGPSVRLQAALVWRRDNPSAALRTMPAVAEDTSTSPASLGEIERERV